MITFYLIGNFMGPFRTVSSTVTHEEFNDWKKVYGDNIKIVIEKEDQLNEDPTCVHPQELENILLCTWQMRQKCLIGNLMPHLLKACDSKKVVYRVLCAMLDANIIYRPEPGYFQLRDGLDPFNLPVFEVPGLVKEEVK